MKIAAGFMAVIVALLGMIAGIGNLDGSITFGEPSTDATSVDQGGPMTSVEKAYLDFMIATLQSVSNDIHDLGVLFNEPAPDDENWQAVVTILLNRIQLGSGVISTVEPTRRLQPFQDASVSALDHSAEFARLVRVQLEQGDTDLTEGAATELMAAADAFGQAEDLLTGFLAAHPEPE